MNNSRLVARGTRPPALGFTLLEVMISLVVLAIGVMGILGLQTSTYKQLQSAQNFSKAALLAGDMADRMLANQDQVLAGAYTHDSPTTKPSPDCGSAACTSVELAAYDVWHWQAQLLGEEVVPLDEDEDESETRKVPGSLPAASGEVLINTVQYPTVSESEYIIIVRWDDDLDGDTGKVCTALDPQAVQGANDLDCYALNLGCLSSEACP